MTRMLAALQCRRAGAAMVLCALVALASCQFGALRRNLKVLDRNGYLRGAVAPPAGAAAAPLVVFAVPMGGSAAEDYVVLARPGPYFLVVPVGTYRIGGFSDDNHSLTHDAGEAFVWIRGGEPECRGQIVDKPRCRQQPLDERHVFGRRLNQSIKPVDDAGLPSWRNVPSGRVSR